MTWETLIYRGHLTSLRQCSKEIYEGLCLKLEWRK